MLHEDLERSLAYLSERRFVGPNPLPLPSYLIFVLGMGRSLGICRHISVLLAFIAKFAIGKVILSHSKGRLILPLIFAAVSTLCSPISPSSDAHFAELFMGLAIRAIMASEYLQISCYLGLALCCDSFGLILLSVALLKALHDLYNKMINPENGCKIIVGESLKILGSIFVLPICFFIAAVATDLMVRNRHSDMSLNYSIPFQSSLKHFDVEKGFSRGHSSRLLPKEESTETHQYVMDRSIISLLSKKHKSFFKIDDAVGGSTEFVHFCEIHKIHEAEFDTEEPRFIKNGNYIKFKDLSEDRFIGAERKDSDTKFVDLYLGNFESDEDLWEVECDGYLRARSTEARFRNVKSGDYLSARKIKSTTQLTSSYYSEDGSRVFYIAANENHEYYKVSFKDSRARSTIKSFPKMSWMSMLVEYIRFIRISQQDSFRNLLIELKDKALLNGSVGCAVVLMLVLNEISRNRYNVSFKISEKTCILTILFILLAAMTILVDVKAALVGSLSHALLVSFMADLYDEYMKGRSIKVHLKQIKNK